jgi:hypothetical protein
VFSLFQVTLLRGTNNFNVIGTGDGSVNDALGMTIYDDLVANIVAATSDSDLNILFSSQSLIGQHIDVATCPVGYDLDTSGGQGNYVCVKTLTTDCL